MDLDLYPEVRETKNVMTSCNSIAKIGGYRKMTITATECARAKFLDEEGNFRIDDYYLEEYPMEIKTVSTVSGSADVTLVNRIKELETQISSMKEVSLLDVEKKFVVDKFNGKQEAVSWMESFDKECLRYEILNEQKKIEALRFFLEGSALEWYASNYRKLSLSEWEPWKKSFLNVYESENWSSIRIAFGYKFLGGSFVDYAIKKERFLLDADREMHEKFRIYQIVYGLPIETQNRLDRQKIKKVDDLFIELKKLTVPFKKKIGDELVSDKKSFESKKDGGKKPCTICEKLGFKGRFHPVQFCRNKDSRQQRLVNWTEENDSSEQLQEKN